MVNAVAAKVEGDADSPISVLEDEGRSESDLRIDLEDNESPCDGEVLLVPEDLAIEEKRLEEERAKREDNDKQTKNGTQHIGDLVFSRLEALLNQTQLYSEFLLEQMEDAKFGSSENADANDPKPEVRGVGRGRKRRGAASNGNGGRGRKKATMSNAAKEKAKDAVQVMLENCKEDAQDNDSDDLKEEERNWKEQMNLVPLLTGGRLKSYQIKGVKWLISLWQNGLSGILADQMGLGKTVQTIGVLAHLKGKDMHGPFLVIAPLTTLSNWVNEITRFVPSMNALLYHGSKIERDELRRKHMSGEVGPDFPVIVTSYEVAMNDVKALVRYKWKYLVVDEGHRLKNFECKLLRELKQLDVDNKVLLTGTPLQNNLAELWSLLNFILPDVFTSRQEFESWFDLGGRQSNGMGEEEEDEKRRVQVISKLHLILRPFLLRRLKEEVEQNLPKKKEIILYANMTEHQKQIQDHLVNKTLEAYLQSKAERGTGMKTKLNNLMIQLRKNCNHPDLLESQFDQSIEYPPVDQLVEQCGKFGLLDRLVLHLKAREHKILIFSQFTKVLDLLEYYLYERGHEVCRIDGGVKLEDRKKQINDFNDPESKFHIFLLSTRAGGLGINLTSADTCIIYDSDWNPQMDLQAMDRCHRIGQTKPVHVYRLVTAHSVEGRMLKVAFGKLKLEHLVIEKGQFCQERVTNTLEEADLIALLKQEKDEEEELIQTEIDDANLLRLLNRSDMLKDSAGNDKASSDALPLKGPGWEIVVRSGKGGSVLSSIEGYRQFTGTNEQHTD
ncbi:ATP-dependent DNA helicase DDM1 [Cryptomeria japonica]|uniref:ATP-dependent DNA helicase DDM1 n=1 Tax=Cryptomeria japonica TaxID=3369 RepID=UPI0027D9FC45|nr:ATP-dependent DNA helicase DDM1 [Cryptomeria japonica]XP_057857657.2 ATP-dependent DNA helicase DDM1 [Cryptomeria japonica]XP_057857658.2 ATP-dependent DNA helicase DDM1 [Cryptomeria japonica]